MAENAIPTTQKAWVNVRSGRPEKALVLQTDYPVRSKLKKDEVLVKVQAAALNPVYDFLRVYSWPFTQISCRGMNFIYKLPGFMASRPMPAEYDFSGVVVDANGTSFNNGDPVYGFLDVSAYTLQI